MALIPIPYDRNELFIGNAMVRSGHIRDMFVDKAKLVTDFFSLGVGKASYPLCLHPTFDGNYRLLGEFLATSVVAADTNFVNLENLIPEEIFPIAGMGVTLTDTDTSPNTSTLQFITVQDTKKIRLLTGGSIPDGDVIYFDIKIEIIKPL